MDTTLQVISYGVVAVLASIVTYLFSVRTTRKGKLYDAKMKAYGDIVGLYQEALIGLDNLSNLQELDTSDKNGFLPNLMNLMGELSGLGDTETLSTVSDPSKLSRTIRQKGDEQFIESLRSRATILNSSNIAASLKEVRFRAGQLALVKPSDQVKEGLTRVQESIASGGLVVFQRAIDRYPEVFGDIEIPEKLSERIITPDEWRKQVGTALGDLVKSMLSDLERTL